MIENHLLKISPIREGELPVLQKAAAEDNHGAVIAASWVVRKDKEIVGYVGHFPTVNFWLHTQKCHGRDSVHVINFVENMFAGAAIGSVIGTPIPEKSPFLPYAETYGFVQIKDSRLWLKNIGY